MWESRRQREGKCLKPKPETRNPKEIRKPKRSSRPHALRISDFGFPSDFGFRAWDLRAARWKRENLRSALIPAPFMNWPGRVTTQLRKCFHLGNCVSKLASVQTQSPLQNVAGCDLRTPDQDYRTYCQDRGIDDPEQPLTPALSPSDGEREKPPRERTSNIQHRTANIQQPTSNSQGRG